MPATALGPNDAVQRAIRRAVIEVHTLGEAKQPLTHACKISPESDVDLSNITFSAGKGSAPALTYNNPGRRQAILDSVDKSQTSGKGLTTSSTMQGSAGSTMDIVEREVVRDSDEFILGDSFVPKSVGEPAIEPINDDTWLAVSLRDPILKFAVSERELPWQYSADCVVDIEACYAIDWKADSGSCHIENPRCARPCGPSHGNPKAEEACGTAHYPACSNDAER